MQTVTVFKHGQWAILLMLCLIVPAHAASESFICSPFMLRTAGLMLTLWLWTSVAPQRWRVPVAVLGLIVYVHLFSRSHLMAQEQFAHWSTTGSLSLVVPLMLVPILILALLLGVCAYVLRPPLAAVSSEDLHGLQRWCRWMFAYSLLWSGIWFITQTQMQFQLAAEHPSVRLTLIILALALPLLIMGIRARLSRVRYVLLAYIVLMLLQTFALMDGKPNLLFLLAMLLLLPLSRAVKPLFAQPLASAFVHAEAS